MRALVLDGELRFTDQHPEPEPDASEALVRVRMAGICGTDLEMLGGYADFTGVPGHEFVGTVERCASRPELVGERVVADINVSCGACATCRAGRRTHCPWRLAIGIRGHDGAFAERIVLPATNLHRVPLKVRDEEAVFAEPLAAACRIVEQVTVTEGDQAVVVGDGRLGLLCAQVLAQAGAKVTVAGRHPEHVERIACPGISFEVSGNCKKRSFPLVVEATGWPDGLSTALELVRPTGTVVVKSTCAGDPIAEFDRTRLVVDEIRLLGSRCGPLPRALELLSHRAVKVFSMVDDEFSLDDGLAAFDRADEPGVLKVLIRP